MLLNCKYFISSIDKNNYIFFKSWIMRFFSNWVGAVFVRWNELKQEELSKKKCSLSVWNSRNSTITPQRVQQPSHQKCVKLSSRVHRKRRKQERSYLRLVCSMYSYKFAESTTPPICLKFFNPWEGENLAPLQFSLYLRNGFRSASEYVCKNNRLPFGTPFLFF